MLNLQTVQNLQASIMKRGNLALPAMAENWLKPTADSDAQQRLQLTKQLEVFVQKLNDIHKSIASLVQVV